jgi:methylase of polypeptide subunit release factors
VTTTAPGMTQVTDEGSVSRPADAFWDNIESEFYAQCVRDFLLRDHRQRLHGHPIIELGSGTGEAIAGVLAAEQFTGRVLGYELQPEACTYAQGVAGELVPRYQILNGDFFQMISEIDHEFAISNPPYLPAPDNDIAMPELWGGPDGSAVTRRLLDCGFAVLVSMLASVADPVGTIAFARARGYRVADFAVRTMRFGTYSSEPKVRDQIQLLTREGPRAFVRDDRYCLAGVLWTRSPGSDLGGSLQTALTSLSTPDLDTSSA